MLIVGEKEKEGGTVSVRQHKVVTKEVYLCSSL